ncbi:MAG: DUF805 domain-containing protein [Pseudomonadota bacterium]
MTPIAAISTSVRHAWHASGRASRSELFWTLGVFVPAYWLLGRIAEAPATPALIAWPAWAAGIVAFVVVISTLIRRMHDVGHSGWVVLLPAGILFGAFALAVSVDLTALMLIGGFAAFICLIVVLSCLTAPSDPAPNRYGLPPGAAPEAFA